MISIESKITNNKTEDTIYIFNSTYEYGDSMQQVVEDNNITKVEATTVLKLEAGKNIGFKDIMDSSEDCLYGLMYTLDSGIKKSHTSLTYEEIECLLENSKIKRRSAIVYKMDDSVDCTEEALEVCNKLIKQRQDSVKKYYTITEFAEIICVTPQTLRNWDKDGKLKPAVSSEEGWRLYSFEQLLGYSNNKKQVSNKGMGYVVNNGNQLDSVIAIKNFFKTVECEEYDIIEDENKPLDMRDNFKELIKHIIKGRLKYVVIVSENKAIPVENIDLLNIIAESSGCEVRTVYLGR